MRKIRRGLRERGIDPEDPDIADAIDAFDSRVLTDAVRAFRDKQRGPGISADLPRASVEGEKPTRDVIRIFKASLGNSKEILLGALREAGYNIEGL